jgi:hypothetical protein
MTSRLVERARTGHSARPESVPATTPRSPGQLRLEWGREGRGGRIPRDEDQDHLHRWLRSRLAGQTGEHSDPGVDAPAARRAASGLERPGNGADRAPTPLGGYGFLSPGTGAAQEDDDPETVVDHALPGKVGRVTRLGPGAIVGSRDEDTDDGETVVLNARAYAAALDFEGTDDPATARAPDHPAFSSGARPNPGGAATDSAWDPETVQLSRMPLSFIGESVVDPETKFDQRPDAARWREETSRFDEVPPGPLPSAVPDQFSPTLARGERAEGEDTDHGEVEVGFDLRTAVLVPILGGAVVGVLSVMMILAFIAGWLAM